MKATGATGEVSFDGEVVTLRRAALIGGEVRSYALAEIAALEWRAATVFDAGFLRVHPRGTSAAFMISQDRNAVGFRKEQEEPFIALYEELHRALYGTEPDAADLRKEPSTAGRIAAGLLAVGIIVFVAAAVFG